ncbi:Tda11p [Saccharomyces paradoxus]|uniref:Topoisomerase I damage affected protein 11 n=1 Tax=Saccharomyces paradoxus TaxID=27291 RepID=A0A8B8UST5_SACPA|nr:Tda11 [Saccharomyces paradoxus]QHS73795.1 Tda11 [Saccharomyces paradoxus]
MNKFDEFIESNEKDLDVDTSTRNSIISMSPVGKTRSKFRSSSSNGYRPEHQRTSSAGSMHSQRLMTPTRLNEQDHPLQAKSDARRVVTRHSSVSVPNAMSKRRSLIQPMVVPTTPESQNNIPFGGSVSHSEGSHGIPLESTTVLSSEQAMTGGLRRSRNGSSQSVNSIAATAIPTNGVDVSALLQSLATKELELLECKQKIEDLKKQTQHEEQNYARRARELHELKEQVSKHLDPSLNTPVKSRAFSPVYQSIPMESRTENAGNSNFSSSVRTRKNVDHPSTNQPRSVSPQDIQETRQRDNSSNSSKQSLWSKPLALFNQFDKIIQHEIERTLNWDDSLPGTPEAQEATSTSNGEYSAQHHDSETPGAHQNSPSQGSVSRSLWSFVSDVKAGLLGIEEENDSDVTNDNRCEPVYRSDREHEQKKNAPKITNRGQAEDSGDDSSLDMKKFKTTTKLQKANADDNNLTNEGGHRRRESKNKRGSNKLNFIGDYNTCKPNNDISSVKNSVEMTNF